MLRLRPRTRPCARLFSHAPLGLSTVARGEPENQTSRVTCRQTQGEWKTGGLNFAVDAPREGRGSESQPLLQMWGAGEGGALGSGRHTRRARLARCGGGRAGRPGEVSSAKVWGTMKDYSEQEQQVKAGGRRDGQCRMTSLTRTSPRAQATRGPGGEAGGAQGQGSTRATDARTRHPGQRLCVVPDARNAEPTPGDKRETVL